MNNLYRQLPDEFVKRRKVFDWSDSEYPIDLSPFDYYDTNPPVTWSEFMAYENKKDNINYILIIYNGCVYITCNYL